MLRFLERGFYAQKGLEVPPSSPTPSPLRSSVRPAASAPLSSHLLFPFILFEPLSSCSSIPCLLGHSEPLVRRKEEWARVGQCVLLWPCLLHGFLMGQVRPSGGTGNPINLGMAGRSSNFQGLTGLLFVFSSCGCRLPPGYSVQCGRGSRESGR